MPSPGPHLNRRESAAATFAAVAVSAYATLRLLSWLGGEPDPRTVVASEHVGYYVRVWLCLWLGGLGAATGWWWPAVGRLAARLLPPVVLGAVAVAIAVP